MRVAIPARVPIPGKPLATRIVTGYAGSFVKVEADGHTHLVPKNLVSSMVHQQLNIALRKGRKPGGRTT